MQQAYAFQREEDLDTALQMAQQFRDYSTVNRDGSGDSPRTIFAKVTELRAGTDDKQCKATEVVYNADTQAFEAPTGTAWIFNSDNVANDNTTTDIFSSETLEVDEVVEVFLYPDKSESEQWMARKSGGGSSLVYATSPNTTLDASYTYGATFDEPAGTGTALGSSALFYLSTPWNTRLTAPTALFAWWNKISDNYYLPVDDFYCKPTANYTANTGVGTFTCYYNDSETHSLGTNTAFPSGVKAVLDGFDAVNASSNSQSYFNGKIFPCRYDSENNIIYLDHPKF
jgi:hypothetical protein